MIKPEGKILLSQQLVNLLDASHSGCFSLNCSFDSNQKLFFENPLSLGISKGVHCHAIGNQVMQ